MPLTYLPIGFFFTFTLPFNLNMKRLLFILLYFSFTSTAQNSVSFVNGYSTNEYVPAGLLEAVAFTNTRMQEITGQENVSCSGMPLPYGIMGVFENGAGYFRENGALIAQLSGISIAQQKASVTSQIFAYSIAFNVLMQQQVTDISQKNDPTKIYSVLEQLSEISDSGIVNLYARDAQIYEILRFMNSSDKAQLYQFPVHNFNLVTVFGADNYKVLSAKRVALTSTEIVTDKNEAYTISVTKSAQYGPAIWNPAPSCNFSSRNGTAVSAITIHTIQGSYAGAISWSQNCSSSVSFHYVVRSSDGQITQMVLEENKGWHVGSENPYTIGYEHEGYVDNPVWYTEAMYNNSADLSRDIITSGYGISGLRTYFGASSASTQLLGSCIRIKGHQHYANQTHTDPGINWNWEKYYRLINNAPSTTTITSTTGNFYDSGGSAGNYQDDERLLWLLAPTNASSITINFTGFSLENNYDYLFIYDGNSINAPLIGTYTSTNSPGTITSSGSSLFFEFRSDCGTVASGWAANWTSVVPNTIPPTTLVENLNDWKTADWTANFTDGAVGAVDQKYYLAGTQPSGFSGWKANTNLGFLNEDFQDNANDWTQHTDVWNVTSNAFVNTDVNLSNTNTHIVLQQDNQFSYLYHWKQNITSIGANQRAGLHFFCDDPTLPNRGNSYFVYFRNSNNKAEIYEVVNDVFTMQTADNCVVNTNEIYDYKVTFDPQTGWIRVFVNGSLTTEWQDPTPLTSGNSISLRTGNCNVEYDNIRVYKSRNNNAPVSVGLTGAFYNQSTNSIETGLVRSLVLDDTDLWSAENYALYKVDWTAPIIDVLSDGSMLDIDTTYLSTLDGNWTAYDLHSGVTEYEVALGTTALATDIQAWTSNGLSTIHSHILSNPIFDQVYYISVRAKNGADLVQESSTDGQRYVEEPSSASLVEELLKNIQVYPNPTTDYLTFKNIPFDVAIFLYSMDGKLIFQEQEINNTVVKLPEMANGFYNLVISKGNQVIVKKVEIVR